MPRIEEEFAALTKGQTFGFTLTEGYLELKFNLGAAKSASFNGTFRPKNGGARGSGLVVAKLGENYPLDLMDRQANVRIRLVRVVGNPPNEWVFLLNRG